MLPDKLYLQMAYRIRMGQKLDLSNPKTFNEKIQWLKLYDRKPEYAKLVDKNEVKNYVRDVLGNDYIIPTIGIWNNAEEIDFNLLPQQFVLKCTHDSGGLVICRDKSKLNLAHTKRVLTKSLKRNYYLTNREWPYKYCQRKIICEKYMEQADGQSLVDYKFYCFNGVPRFLYVSKGLEDHSTASISFLTLDWKFADYERSDYKPFSELPQKPKNLEQMIELSKKLSANHKFMRVDLYEINESIYFSELTFHPCSGFMPFKNYEQDLSMGELLEL